ncbi:MAG: sulfotransferase domain-containing protein, partial [Patescibacteria group bacterium]
MKKKIIIGKRKPLVRHLLLVEGISRSGKFLLADLLSGLRGIEPVQYYGLLEHIPVFEAAGLIDRRTAEEILRCEIDTHCYEMLIGRNLNHRVSDKSSIFKNPRAKEFVRRSAIADDETLNRFYQHKAYSLFILHEIMPYIRLYFDTFKNITIKTISVRRHPVDLVYSWHRRGLMERLGKDPKLFMIPAEGGRGPMPWFVHGRQEEYYALSSLDRIIFCIEQLFKKYNSGYCRLPPAMKKKILFVDYETIVTDTKSVIQRLSGFLQKGVLPEMKGILRRE